MTDKIDEGETMNLGLFKKYAALKMAQKKCQDKADEISKRCAKLEPDLIEILNSHEIENLPLKGGRTIYVRSTLWPKYIDGQSAPDLIKAAKEDGLHELVSEGVNAQRFAAYIRELHENDEPIPKNIAKVVEKSWVEKLIVNKH